MRSRLGVLLVMLAAGCDGNSATVVVTTAHADAAPAPLADLSVAGPRDLAVSPADAGIGVGTPNDLAAAADLSAAVADLSAAADLSSAPDLATARDLAPAPSPAPTPDGGGFTEPPPNDTPVVHAPPSPLGGASTLLAGQDVRDVSTDQGGGVWAVTASTVYYFPAGRSAPFTYNQSSGLARGQSTWTDTYYSPGTYPVEFTAVAGGTRGEAILGETGTIGDRMIVDSSTGAVQRIDNMKVTQGSLTNDEYQAQLQRIVSVWRTVADLNNVWDGTAYLGGWHGFYAFHGIDGDCGCMMFEQHQHAFTAWAPDGIGGGDVRALAFSPDGDVWQGDRDLVALWPVHENGANTDFLDISYQTAVDVFPGVRDEVWGLGVDRSNGVYVASYGNGLAYLAPATQQPTYWSSATTLPQNHLTDVTVDGAGEVWIATLEAGLARFNPATSAWSYYTTASGLASDEVHRVYVDKYGSTRVLYFATANGLTIFHP